VAHGFTGRPLHLAQRPPPVGPLDDDVLAGNWSRAIHPHGVERLSLLSQIHGDRVHLGPDPGGPLAPVGEGDALVAVELGAVVAVRVADCVPVLLAAVAGGRAVGVAAVHAGWRGAAAGVVPRAIDALLQATDTVADGVVAAIGPSICGAHYEVGFEVVEALVTSGVPSEAFVVGRSERGRPLVDVAAAVALQLAMAGVSDVERVGDCTFESDRLWSHRRDGPRGGRQAAWIVRVP
jgi:hypothetical protein